MSLYDSYRQANNGYMSQFTGSIVPELSNFTQTVAARYNQSADSDDALTEALGNLQHLDLDADAQYANELKQDYYKRLIDRSDRGDFENMGRRTRRDAVQFAQAYQPLIQRQRDLAEVVKKVNSDENIADPNKKAQILQYIKDMNSVKRNGDGEFERDATGRVRLGAIQDWAYAKDVDINKKLADLLSKKETEIRQSGYASDGQGLKISSVQELRSPEMMARMAKQMMATDPEIKAMINRDVTLQNYRYGAGEVEQVLKGSDSNLYDDARKRGLSKSQIAVLAKANGMTLEEAKESTIGRQRKQLMAQGMSKEAADRAILNNRTAEQIMQPHMQLMADLLSVDKRKLEAREDGLLVAERSLRMKKAMDDADVGNFQVLQTSLDVDTEMDPGKISTDYAQKTKAMKQLRGNVQAVALQALKTAGLATGDPKKDMALAGEYANDRTKMNLLKAQVAKQAPDLAGRMETIQNGYLASRDEVAYHRANTVALEEAAGVNWNNLYERYKKGDFPEMVSSSKPGKPLSKEDFINQVRDRDSDGRSSFKGRTLKEFFTGSDLGAVRNAAAVYDKAMAGAVTKMGKTRLDAFNPIQPQGPGYLKDATEVVSSAAKLGTLKLRDLQKPGSEPTTLAEILGINQKKLNDKTNDEYKAMDAADVLINRNSVNGKRTITVRTPDGVTKVLTVERGLDPKVFNELDSRMLQQTTTHHNRDMARSQAADILTGIGEGTMIHSAAELKDWSPSSVKHPINEMYEVKVIPGGPEGKRWQLSVRGGPAVKIFNSADDLVQTIGTDEFNRTKPQK